MTIAVNSDPRSIACKLQFPKRSHEPDRSFSGLGPGSEIADKNSPIGNHTLQPQFHPLGTRRSPVDWGPPSQGCRQLCGTQSVSSNTRTTSATKRAPTMTRWTQTRFCASATARHRTTTTTGTTADMTRRTKCAAQLHRQAWQKHERRRKTRQRGAQGADGEPCRPRPLLCAAHPTPLHDMALLTYARQYRTRDGAEPDGSTPGELQSTPHLRLATRTNYHPPMDG
ncbi:hypothetical protein C8J57DRAFT_1517753 [Mycena rebaudengoi]|nr:hypothetical protein C8J57DRAFT_1517753 [Mycena rebaudengoi]